MSLSNTFSQIQTNLQTTVQGIVNQVLGSLLAGLNGKRSLPQVSTVIATLQNTFNISIKQLIEKVKAIYIKYQAQIQQFLTTFNKPQLMSASHTAKAEIEKSLQDFFDCIENGFYDAVNTVIAAGINVASWLGISVGKRGIFDGFGDILSGLTSTLGGHIDNITGSLSSLGSNLVGAVTPHLQDLQDQLTNHALNAAQSLLGTLAGISGTLQG